jgi:inositol oxygenase
MVRPEPIFANKPIEAFRHYEGTSSIHERVFRTYKLMHTHQTTEFAQRKVILKQSRHFDLIKHFL